MQAQHYVGARGGYGGGSGNRFYPKQTMGTLWDLYSGGISWKYYSPERFLGGVEIDILFMQQGYKLWRPTYMSEGTPGEEDFREWYENIISDNHKVNSIVVPIFWQPHVYMFNRNLRIFLNLGVTFSYNISAQDMKHSKVEGVLEDWHDYEFSSVRDNRFGYGLAGGGGVNVSIGKRLELLAEARYYINYADIYRNKTKYPANEYLRSPMDNLQFSVGFFYRLGKGGILAPAGRKLTEKMRLAEEQALAAPTEAEVNGVLERYSGEGSIRQEMERTEETPDALLDYDTADPGSQPEEPGPPSPANETNE